MPLSVGTPNNNKLKQEQINQGNLKSTSKK
jgi:hypothetical protein